MLVVAVVGAHSLQNTFYNCLLFIMPEPLLGDEGVVFSRHRLCCIWKVCEHGKPLGEFHQIYSFGALGDTHELIGF